MFEEMELLRKKIVKLDKNWPMVAFASSLLTVLLFIFIRNNLILLITLCLPVLIVLNANSLYKKKYMKLYKENIVIPIFKSHFSDVVFNYAKGLSKDVIASTDMLKMGSMFSSSDYIKASYKKILFEMSELRIEGFDSENGSPYFEGQWYIFDFNKQFKSNVQIREKGFETLKKASRKLKKIEMEDMEFNKQFEVYADNQEDAFYILTPNMMEKIKQLSHQMNGKISLCFMDRKLHIAVDTWDDFFEPDYSKEIDLKQEYYHITKIVEFMKDFVNVLDLDNDLFKIS